MFTKQIKRMLIERDMTAQKLSAILGTTQQNLSKKMVKDDFKESDMQEICKALNFELNIEVKPK